jgi:aspartate racemase
MIDVCLNNIEAHFAEMKSKSTVGILGGKGCMVGRVYQDALEKRGIEYFVLDEARQDKAMEAIYCVKQGKIGEARTTFKPLLDFMVSQGVKSVILGCTEIPIIIKEDFDLPRDVKFFDSCDLLADTVVKVAKGLKELEDVL